MVDVLADPRLYEFTGGAPPTLAQLEARYVAQSAGSPRPDEVWHNWIVRLGEPAAAIGFVQATVGSDRADVAWVIGTRWQGRGCAAEAAAAMCGWLLESGVAELGAHIRPGHVASEAVATRCGLVPTDDLDADGERRWSLPTADRALGRRAQALPRSRASSPSISRSTR
jgi:RimJ/RimL family protein N-acetyltransferase